MEENIRKVSISQILKDNSLAYAKGVIVARAFPGIDGFKVSQRRILYTMNRKKLYDGEDSKSTDVIGSTMKLHAHGDASIYETSVGMIDSVGKQNIPYILGDGSFGRVYSRDMMPSKPRYTHEGLTQFAREMLKGIDRNEVDIIPNFDNTLTEVKSIPVKVPTILLNPVTGVAVGKSCSIPPFPLKNVCEATCKVITGEVTEAEQLADILEYPEYPTGAYIHASHDDIVRLCKTGKGTFKMSAEVELYNDRIEVVELPYGSTVEEIYDEIVDAVKKKELREVADVHDKIGKNGMSMSIILKRGYKAIDVLQKLYRLTSLRDSVSYDTKVIIGEECKENISLLDLINLWIEFRDECLRKRYEGQLSDAEQQVHLLSSWLKIKDEASEVLDILVKNSKAVAKKKIMEKYGLDEEQAQSVMRSGLDALSTDGLQERCERYQEALNKIDGIKKCIEDPVERKKVMLTEINAISAKYSKDRKTKLASPIIENKDLIKGEEVKDETTVVIKYTNEGYIKRLETINQIRNYEPAIGDFVLKALNGRNCDTLLVFTYSGECYKIPVDEIDVSKGPAKEKLYHMLGLASQDEIMYVDITADFSEHFNIVYGNGKGYCVRYSRVSGNRKQYVSLYEPAKQGQCWVTKADKFFVITKKKKACYAQISMVDEIRTRSAFRAARIKSDDAIFFVQDINTVPNIEDINIEKYRKEYCVSIGNDILWNEDEVLSLQRKKERAKQDIEEEKRRLEKEQQDAEMIKILRKLNMGAE